MWGWPRVREERYGAADVSAVVTGDVHGKPRWLLLCVGGGRVCRRHSWVRRLRTATATAAAAAAIAQARRDKLYEAG